MLMFCFNVDDNDDGFNVDGRADDRDDGVNYDGNDAGACIYSGDDYDEC